MLGYLILIAQRFEKADGVAATRSPNQTT
ncbi:MAG: hypothetical protein JWR19_1961, partial [Pedosphaera sp.]|nr:hypothetical protein [Pedosphaera sp.]